MEPVCLIDIIMISATARSIEQLQRDIYPYQCHKWDYSDKQGRQPPKNKIDTFGSYDVHQFTTF